MQRDFFRTICLILALTSAVAHSFEDHVVVRKRDRVGNATYEVMTGADLRELENAARRDKALQVKALAKAQKDWEADTSNEGESFPRSVATASSVRAVKRCRDIAEARESANRYTQREKEQIAKEKRDRKEKYRIYQSYNKNDRNRNRNQKPRYDMARYNTYLKREEERLALLEKAVGIYESALEACRNDYEARRSDFKAKQEKEYGTPTPSH